MSEFSIKVEAGKSKRLLTAGKYCDRDIVVTAEGGGSGGLPTGFSAFEVIDWTPSSNTSAGTSNEIPHSLGTVPDGFYIVPAEGLSMSGATQSQGYVMYAAFDVATDASGAGMRAISTSRMTTTWINDGFTSSSVGNFVTETTLNIRTASNTGRSYRGGHTYHVIVYKR